MLYFIFLIFFIFLNFSFFLCITVVWPHNLFITPIKARYVHFFVKSMFMLERCIVCRCCTFICGPHAIRTLCKLLISGYRYCSEFYFSYNKCIFCGYCILVCPTECLISLNFFFLFFYNVFIWETKFLLTCYEGDL